MGRGSKNVDKRVGVGVGVMMLKAGRVLLGKRHSDPKKADSELHGEGMWTMPGGKLEYGETFEEGTKREVKEEAGMVLHSALAIGVSEDMNEYAHFVTIAMFSNDFSGEPRVMEPDEITEWRWFPLDALPKPLFPPSAKIIDLYRLARFPGKRKVL